MITTNLAPDTAQTRRVLEELFGHITPTRVGFRLWDGSHWPDEAPRDATLVLKHPDSIQSMFAPGTEKGLAEAYLRDDFDVEGDLEAASALADVFTAPGHRSWSSAARLGFHLRRPAATVEPGRMWRALSHLGQRIHSRGRDRDAVSFHYDVSNDFYRLWLDTRLQYSCAYFEHPTDDLDTAQLAKLHHVCRKLRLQAGHRLLDIGCGWGGLALYAAQRYGVQVTGVTLSRRQAELARNRVAESGLSDDVEIELKDYRDLPDIEAYDAVVSIGMAEHVGRENLPNYFAKVFTLLKPGGVFLNHAIGDGVRARPATSASFIQEYVFPDSDIPPLSQVLPAAEEAGFEIRDVENLREHYMLTLRHWVRRLEAAHAEARAYVDEPTYRIWRLYMAACAHGFDGGRMAVYQTMLSKLDAAGRAFLPLTRRDWY